MTPFCLLIFVKALIHSQRSSFSFFFSFFLFDKLTLLCEACHEIDVATNSKMQDKNLFFYRFEIYFENIVTFEQACREVICVCFRAETRSEESDFLLFQEE